MNLNPLMAAMHYLKIFDIVSKKFNGIFKIRCDLLKDEILKQCEAFLSVKYEP
jgi:hypothetical protein